MEKQPHVNCKRANKIYHAPTESGIYRSLMEKVDLEYPDKWNMDVYLGVMLFITSDKCCDFVLGSGYDDCTVSDDCTPESIPISNKEHTSCSKWYPSTIESNTCTNNKDDIPPEWSDASYNYLFSSTSEECCQLMFAGKACNVKSCEGHTQLGDSFQVVTGSPTEQPSSKCVSDTWVGDLNRGDGCTNSPDAIPSSWYQYPEFYLFDSPQACKLPRPCLLVSCSFPRTDLSLIHLLFKGCSALFRDMPCAIHVDCLTSGGPTISDNDEPISCVSDTWYPHPIHQDGCSNSPDDIPAEWISKAFYFSTTSVGCCSSFFSGKPCKVYQVCENPVASMKPTSHPNTPVPIPSPTTTSPSISPTTLVPSPSPTNLYYVSSSDGLCHTVDSDTPAWYSVHYTDYEKCCKYSWKVEECLASDPDISNAPSPTAPPTKLYYVSSSTGMCEIVDTNTPAWYTVRYADYVECCQWSWKKEDCLAANPNPETLGEDTSSSMTPDIIVDITMYGSVTIDDFTPPDYYSTDWATLKMAFSKAIVSTMLASELVHNAMQVKLWNIGGKSFQRRELKDAEGMLIAAESGWNEKTHDKLRKLVAPQVLQFEMTIPTKCNEACQKSSGFLGESAFATLQAFFRNYVDSGAFSIVLNSLGDKLGVFGEKSPKASAGELSYRLAVKSSNTWFPTMMPSLSPVTPPPSTSPTTPKPTSSPTEPCYSERWHPLPNFSKCSNKFDDFPIVWKSSDVYMFETKEECCQNFFYNLGKEDCYLEDICQLQSFSDDVTEPTSSAVEETDDECSKRLFHPTTSFSKCTNSLDDYPSVWAEHSIFMQTKEACCKSFFVDSECVVENVCGANSTTSTTKAPETETLTTTIVQATTKASQSPTTVLAISTLTTAVSSTSSTLIVGLQESGNHCNLWHPSKDFTKCTNDPHHDMGDIYLHDTAEECCSIYFGAWGYEDCATEDTCVSSPPSPQPTSCSDFKYYSKGPSSNECTNGKDSQNKPSSNI
eukprot:scaffold6323_cov203-Alexandrium_tamarense.AAC.10